MEKELALRNDLKYLYDAFLLDAQDKAIARRYAQQAYFSIQKQRIRKLMEERLEFHPFWGAHPFASQEDLDEFLNGDDDDGAEE